nr:MAG TPA: hypothetical protein [Bacteriophage sp.]
MQLLFQYFKWVHNTHRLLVVLFYNVILSLYFPSFKLFTNIFHCSGVLFPFPYREWYNSCISFLTHTPKWSVFLL